MAVVTAESALLLRSVRPFVNELQFQSLQKQISFNPFSDPATIQANLLGVNNRGQALPDFGKRVQFFARRPEIARQVLGINKNSTPTNQVRHIQSRLKQVELFQKTESDLLSQNSSLVSKARNFFQQQGDLQGIATLNEILRQLIAGGS